MNSWIEGLNQIGDAWFATISSVCVQSVVVVVLATFAAKLLSNHSASLRFWIWQAAALKLLLIPFSAVIVLPFWPAVQNHDLATTTSYADIASQVSHAASQVIDPPSVLSPAPATLSETELSVPNLSETSPTASAYAFVGWCFVLGMQVVSCFRRKYLLAQLLNRCRPAKEGDWQRLQELAQQLKFKTSARLMQGNVPVPLVTGILRPTIVFPASQELDQTAFEQVALHELAHVQRRDLLWVWLPEVLRMLFFFHPLAYWIQHQAKLCSEMACDELVLSVGSDRHSYANTLLKLATQRHAMSGPTVARMTT